LHKYEQFLGHKTENHTIERQEQRAVLRVDPDAAFGAGMRHTTGSRRTMLRGSLNETVQQPKAS